MKKRMSEWNKSGEGLENMRKEGKYKYFSLYSLNTKEKGKERQRTKHKREQVQSTVTSPPARGLDRCQEPQCPPEHPQVPK